MTCTDCAAPLTVNTERRDGTCTTCFLASLDTSWHRPKESTK